MNISDYLRTALLNHSLALATYQTPSTLWAALYVSSPTSAGGGVEVSAPDYARIATSWNPAVLGRATNAADIRFPAAGGATSDWSTVSTLALLDAPTNGNFLFFGPLSAAVVLAPTADFLVPAGSLVITLN